MTKTEILLLTALVITAGACTQEEAKTPAEKGTVEHRDISPSTVKAGDTEVQYQLGEAAYRAQDYMEAVSRFRKAAEQGHVGAQYMLGIAYDRSEGVEEDDREAARWWQMAAEQGHVDAQYMLGIVYWGDSVDEDPDEDSAEAVRWWQKAAEQGHEQAQVQLSIAYSLDFLPWQHRTEDVFHWLRQAAEQGHADAQYSLGQAYSIGQGVEEDDVEGVRWYKAAAEQGHGNAQLSLSRAYLSGRGVPQNYIEHHAWAILAKAGGDTWQPDGPDLSQANLFMTRSQIAVAQDRALQLRKEIEARKAQYRE